MVLHREERQLCMTEAFDCLIVQIDVRQFDVIRKGLRIDHKAVVLARDLDLAGEQVLDRVIRAAVSELQLLGLRS